MTHLLSPELADVGCRGDDDGLVPRGDGDAGRTGRCALSRPVRGSACSCCTTSVPSTPAAGEAAGSVRDALEAGFGVGSADPLRRRRPRRRRSRSRRRRPSPSPGDVSGEGHHRGPLVVRHGHLAAGLPGCRDPPESLHPPRAPPAHRDGPHSCRGRPAVARTPERPAARAPGRSGQPAHLHRASRRAGRNHGQPSMTSAPATHPGHSAERRRPPEPGSGGRRGGGPHQPRTRHRGLSREQRG